MKTSLRISKISKLLSEDDLVSEQDPKRPGHNPNEKPEAEPEKLPHEDPGQEPQPERKKEDDDDDDDYEPYTEPEIGDDPDEIKTRTTIMQSGGVAPKS